MKIEELKELLKDSRVMGEIHKHLWIESQKAGYNIGIERATDEWLKLYAEGWMKYHVPEKLSKSNNGSWATKGRASGQSRQKNAAKIKKSE